MDLELVRDRRGVGIVFAFAINSGFDRRLCTWGLVRALLHLVAKRWLGTARAVSSSSSVN